MNSFQTSSVNSYATPSHIHAKTVSGMGGKKGNAALKEKPVKVIDQKTNKPIDTVPNSLKLPVPEEEYETLEDKVN